MAETYCFSVSFERRGQRLDSCLTELLPQLTRSRIKRLIGDGCVTCTGVAAKGSLRLKGGEELTITLPDPLPLEVEAQDISLNILFEDTHLVVVDKPPGMVVHPAPGHANNTLVNALLYHCTDLSGIGGIERPGIVHRIDKDTSGIMVVAKSDIAHQSLAAQFKVHSIERRYLALVYGCLPAKQGKIDKPIGRHPVERKKMSCLSRQGRAAVTHWRMLRQWPSARVSLVELKLETGRTHQIRVHMTDRGFPLLGDPVYGGHGRVTSLPVEIRKAVKIFARQALHARLLGFKHPVSDDYMEFTGETAGDMVQLIHVLEQFEPSISSLEGSL